MTSAEKKKVSEMEFVFNLFIYFFRITRKMKCRMNQTKKKIIYYIL